MQTPAWSVILTSLRGALPYQQTSLAIPEPASGPDPGYRHISEAAMPPLSTAACCSKRASPWAMEISTTLARLIAWSNGTYRFCPRSNRLRRCKYPDHACRSGKGIRVEFRYVDVADDGITNGASVTFTLSNGETLTLGSAGNAYDLTGFFGVVDDTPFKTILLTSSETGVEHQRAEFWRGGISHSGASDLGHAVAWLRRDRCFWRAISLASCIGALTDKDSLTRSATAKIADCWLR